MARYVDAFSARRSRWEEPEGLLAHGPGAGAKVWKDLGALEYRECLGDDLKVKFGVPSPRLAKLKPGETVASAGILYKSRADRDRINAKAG